jgi:hypothetical protein
MSILTGLSGHAQTTAEVASSNRSNSTASTKRESCRPEKVSKSVRTCWKAAASKVRVTLNFLFRKNTLLPFLVEQGVEFSKINNGSTQLLRLQEQTQESSKQVHSTVSFSMLHCFAWSGHQLNFMLLFWAIVFFSRSDLRT